MSNPLKLYRVHFKGYLIGDHSGLPWGYRVFVLAHDEAGVELLVREKYDHIENLHIVQIKDAQVLSTVVRVRGGNNS